MSEKRETAAESARSTVVVSMAVLFAVACFYAVTGGPHAVGRVLLGGCIGLAPWCLWWAFVAWRDRA